MRPSLRKTVRAGLAMALAATAAFSLAACSSRSAAAEGFAADSDTLVFGVVPDAVDTETNYEPLMDYLALKTGKKVEYHESTDYLALIEASVAGKVDVVSMSGFTYVTAVAKGALITPVSSVVTQPGEKPGFWSQAIVPTDSPLQGLSDFKAKRVCFVDPSSTSGYLFPVGALLDEGIDATADLTPVFAGKHDVVVRKVADGKECDAGFAEDSEVMKSDDVRVVAQTWVPGQPLAVSTALPADLQATLTAALSNVTADEIAAAGIEGANSPGFRAVFHSTEPVDDATYDPVRELCAETGAPQCQS
jgi:phosphonate transport system substrate-binding protein